jgi:hypothetical protein
VPPPPRRNTLVETRETKSGHGRDLVTCFNRLETDQGWLDIPGAQKWALWYAIQKHANPDFEFWPKIDTWARGCGQSPSTVKAAIKAAGKTGILSVRKRRWEDSGKARSSVYAVADRYWRAGVDLEPIEGQESANSGSESDQSRGRDLPPRNLTSRTSPKEHHQREPDQVPVPGKPLDLGSTKGSETPTGKELSEEEWGQLVACLGEAWARGEGSSRRRAEPTPYAFREVGWNGTWTSLAYLADFPPSLGVEILSGDGDVLATGTAGELRDRYATQPHQRPKHHHLIDDREHAEGRLAGWCSQLDHWARSEQN